MQVVNEPAQTARDGAGLGASPPALSPVREASGSARHPTMRFVIVTGISGSGKSQALRIFEDLGYYCVDNLPPALLPQLAELDNGRTPKVACVVDVRAGSGLEALEPALADLKERKVNTTILFLEASDPVLVN